MALKKVVKTYVNETTELIRLFVNGEEIITTPTHPFYSPVRGWTDAVRLRAGDILVLVNGEYVVVEKVQHDILEAPIAVYNFQVEDFHTYYVSNIGVLVHNMCAANRPTSVGNMQQQVVKGRAPSTVVAVHPAHVPNAPTQSPHVHFNDGTSYNLIGTMGHKMNGLHTLTNAEITWLTENRWM